MKKLLALIGLVISSAAFAQMPHLVGYSQKTDEGLNQTTYPAFPSATSGPALFYIDLSDQTPHYLTLGTGLTFTGGVLSASGSSSSQVNSDWNATSGVAQILNKPTLFSGAYADLTGKPVLFSGAYADLTGKPTLATVATSGSYNDLSNKPAIPTVTAFNFGAPTTRTFALTTSYQATDPTKAAVVTPSVQCAVANGNSCTVQVRVATTAVTCATGTVYGQWTNAVTGTLAATVTAGTFPSIQLPIGGYFIFCQTAGSGATIPVAVDQSAG